MPRIAKSAPLTEHAAESAAAALSASAMALADKAAAALKRWKVPLDDWQLGAVLRSLELRADEPVWEHKQAVMIAARQNGKNNVLLARELVGLFLDADCKLVVHSSHEFSSSLEGFRRILDVIEDTPELYAQLKKPGGVKRSHGEEGIELRDGSRLRFKTRTKSGGRGLSSDLLIMDEAMVLQETAMGALYMTMSARPNPQIWFAGSAADEAVHEHGHTLARLREAGLRGDPGTLFVEYSAAALVAELAPGVDPLDAVLADPSLLDREDLWLAANPAMRAGRIRADHVRMELATLDNRTFAVERLGVSRWPATSAVAEPIIDAVVWRRLADPRSEVQGAVVFAVDVAPNRAWSTIAVAGRRADGLLHVEMVERKEGTHRLAARLAELVAEHGGAVALDARGPAASLQTELEDQGVPVLVAAAGDMAKACGSFYDAVMQEQVRHLGTPELASAVAGAATRPLGDAWAWARLRAAVDISPLVAVTLATWGLASATPPVEGLFMFA